jgi:hypothetical protein
LTGISTEEKQAGLALPRIAKALGRAGLLPFLMAPALVYLDPNHSSLYGTALASYALAIVCFLVGSWWGLALIRRGASTLVLSNAVVIVAFFGHALLPTPGFLALCAALYPATILVERRGRVFRAQPHYYASLRLQLTIVATASLLLTTMLLLRSNHVGI